MPYKCKSHADRMRPAKRTVYDAERGTAAERGYDSLWQRARLHKLAVQPLCEFCGRAAEHVHHIHTIKAAPGERLAMANLVSLCRVCHGKAHRKGKADD